MKLFKTKSIDVVKACQSFTGSEVPSCVLKRKTDKFISQGEVLVLLNVFLFFFVRSTISRQPAGRFTPNFACGCTLVPDVSSPLLGVSGPPRAGGKRGK